MKHASKLGRFKNRKTKAKLVVNVESGVFASIKEGAFMVGWSEQYFGQMINGFYHNKTKFIAA